MNDEYSKEQMEEIEATVTLDDYGRNKFDVDDTMSCEKCLYSYDSKYINWYPICKHYDQYEDDDENQ